MGNPRRHDICRKKEVILLIFNFEPEDRAYVVERAHVEKELYREVQGKGKRTIRRTQNAYRKYWESRVPVLEYEGSYSVPQLAIWSPIKFERLNVEWRKPADGVWERVLENNW